jgi:hypothetical protein
VLSGDLQMSNVELRKQERLISLLKEFLLDSKKYLKSDKLFPMTKNEKVGWFSIGFHLGIFLTLLIILWFIN